MILETEKISTALSLFCSQDTYAYSSSLAHSVGCCHRVPLSQSIVCMELSEASSLENSKGIFDLLSVFCDKSVHRASPSAPFSRI
jgi:hypothetical protein